MHKYTGTSLIEILISLMLMAVILLGIDAMQVVSLQQCKANYYFAVAEQQINVMNERIALLKNDEPDEFALIWNKQNQEVLPQGRGIVKSHPDSGLSIYWGNVNEQNCKTSKSGTEGCLHT